MSYLPLFLHASERFPILVIGGGEIAAAKTEALASVGADVRVVAEHLGDAIITLCDAHGYPHETASYTPELLNNIKIVIAATDDDVVNERIASDCRARGILVNVVDNPPLCDFIFPALVRRGDVQVAISSSGVAPVFARLLKHEVEKLLPASYERLIEFMRSKKQALREHLTKLQPRRLFSETILRGAIANEVLEGNRAKADAMFDAALKGTPNANQAALYLVGAGPGNPDLITLKAIRLLSQADVVLYDRLVSPELLTMYARKDAEKISVGKTRCHHHKKQAEIDEMIEALLSKGKIVVRLKGGDPGVYAHGAEEIAIAKKVGVPYQIVPAVSAANGCAAYAGIPLTERGGALSVRYLTIYKDQLHDAHFWEGLSYATNETLVLYMSSHHFGLVCKKLIEAGYDAGTEFLAIEQGTTPYHKELPGTLGDFDADYGDYSFASPTLIIVGDVVKWRHDHHWKEAPEQDGQYFEPLPPKEAA